ncbi:hypothetical protein GCM10010429_07380 [Micromonospora olivasterospora]|uniref:Uncharacterized protein n=2 Tax=Micromonospora olivasterospora TaxID=1880 RepID=A0A562I927_MICOL|nr:hypothetical protein JD77_02517 [Micromonospora olivasterospora]
MVTLPTARRHHRSRTLYAFALLALLGAATILVMAARYPATSATELGTPVPAPEITVIDERADPGWWASAEPGWPDPAKPPEAGAGVADWAEAGTGGGTATAAADVRRDQVSRSLFWSGVIGLAISLAGLGLVGTRRRMW